MTFDESMEYITSFEKNKMKLGLVRIQQLIGILGIDISKQRIIHVAGTNGKGSTSKYIETVLNKAGYNVGLFTSPYFLSQCDAIQIGCNSISESTLASYVQHFKAILSKHLDLQNGLTRFEIVTALALYAFDQHNCDITILETGLGGTYDSTNIVVNPMINVITKISYDHMDYLGDTIESIASNKAGIIKPNAVVVVAVQQYETATNTILKYAQDNNCRVQCVLQEDIIARKHADTHRILYKGIEATLSLRGVHQTQNAATAISVLRVLQSSGFDIGDDHIVSGLESTQWPLRLQRVSRSPSIYFDGAHNIDGMLALCEFIKDNKSQAIKSQNILIIGILRDKEYSKMVAAIAPLVDHVFTLTPSNPRALDSKSLALEFERLSSHVTALDDIKTALTSALDIASKDDNIYIAGSLYLASDIYNVYSNM